MLSTFRLIKWTEVPVTGDVLNASCAQRNRNRLARAAPATKALVRPIAAHAIDRRSQPIEASRSRVSGSCQAWFGVVAVKIGTPARGHSSIGNGLRIAAKIAKPCKTRWNAWTR